MATMPSAVVSPIPPWQPSDNGLLGAVDIPAAFADVTSVLTAGTVYLTKLPIRFPTTITNLIFGLAVAGSGASTGSFAGVYNSAGTLLSGSADIATQLTGAVGPITVPLTSAQVFTAAPAAGFVWAAVVENLAVTQASLTRAGGAGAGVMPFLNMGLAASVYRFATNGTGQTTLPASITPASNAQTSNFCIWAGWT